MQLQYTEKNTEKRSLEHNMQVSSQDVENAEQEVQQLIANLPEPWRTHPAQGNEKEFQFLKAEWEALVEAPDHMQNLWIAQREVHAVQGAITALESQLEQIPQKLRRPVMEVEHEVQWTWEQFAKQEAIRRDPGNAGDAQTTEGTPY